MIEGWGSLLNERTIWGECEHDQVEDGCYGASLHLIPSKRHQNYEGV